MRGLFKNSFQRLLLFLMILFLVITAGCTGNSEKTAISDDDYISSSFGSIEEYDSGDLVVQFLDVGQGSCALIRQGDSYMLVDGGDREYSSFVVSYLKKQGITSLDYVVVSHYDSDHLNGIVGVLNALECKKVLAPDYEEDTRVYQSFLDVIEEKNITTVHPKPGDKYIFANSSFQIVGPNDVYEDANSNSLGIRLEYGNNSFLICGDCTEESEQDILYQGTELKSDVFAANHHGSKYSNSEEFLDAIDPDYVVVSCGRDNSYGHPHASVMLSIQKMNAALYRTDLQGTITAVSNGLTIHFENELCMDYRSGTEITEDADTDPSGFKGEETEIDKIDASYVLNTNSKKFHLPDCNSVADMDETNKEYSAETKESLIEQGYSPCKRCMD